MDRINIATINARGLNNAKKGISVFERINDHDVDIALIQETFCVKEYKKKFNFHWKGDVFHSHSDSKHSRGVFVLLSSKFKGNVSSYNDTRGRKPLLNIEHDDDIYTVVNLYCPNDQGERLRFLNESADWVDANGIENSYLILGGDVNCVQWSSDRSSNKVDSTSELLANLKRSLSIKDVWKLLHPDDIDFTYIDSSFRTNNSRIDILCVCPGLENYVQSCVHKTAPCPDHKAVLMCIGNKERNGVRVTGN